MSKKNQKTPLTGPMAEIEKNCSTVNHHRTRLGVLLAEIAEEQLKVTRKYEQRLREEIGALSFWKGAVHGLVLKARALFLEPKSRKFHDVQVGYEKERDTVTQPADDVLIQRIKELLPNKAALLIAPPIETVRAQAIKDLPLAEKQLLGISTTTGADNAIVRLVKSDVEVQATALLESFTPKAEGKEVAHA